MEGVSTTKTGSSRSFYHLPGYKIANWVQLTGYDKKTGPL